MASIRKRGDKWQARIVRKGFPPIAKSFLTRNDAELWGRAIERELDVGAYIPRSNAEGITVKELIKRYTSEVVPKLRGKETESIRLATIEDKIGSTRLTALTPLTAAQYRDERLNDVCPSTVLRELQTLSAMLNHARREWGLIFQNPVEAIRKPTPNRGRDRRLEPAEEQRLLNALEYEGRRENGQIGKGARNTWIKPLVLLALETAMRRGELLALDWRQVDLKNQTAFLPLTKNGDSRTVPLSSKAIAILRALPRTLSGQVFPVTPNALKHAWTRACASAKIIDLHFHDLRHEATSRIAEKLPNLIELASVTGHKDVKMLARYYHPKAEDLALKLG